VAFFDCEIVSGDLVVGLNDEYRFLRFDPAFGLLEESGWDTFHRVTHGSGGEKLPFFGGVEVVGRAIDTFGGRGGAFALGNLQHPADELIFGEFALGIGDHEDELFLNRRWLLFFAWIGLHGDVHLLDDFAHEDRIDLVLLEDFGYFIDVNFRHGVFGFLALTG